MLPYISIKVFLVLTMVAWKVVRFGLSADIETLDSDYLFLEIRETTLPLPESSATLGVFAKEDIPANEIVCEHRGAIVPFSVHVKSDYIASAVDSQGNKIKIISQPTEPNDMMSICSYINDCTNVFGQEYSVEDLIAIQAQTKTLHTYPGTEYNLRSLSTKMGKILLVSNKFIPKGSELFFSYGGDYWLYRLILSKLNQAQ